VIKLVTISQWAKIIFGNKCNLAVFVFEDAEVTTADKNIALPVHYLIQVQPEIKMADV